MQRLFRSLADIMAILGGLVLSCLILLVCLSVLGRSLNTILHNWIGTIAPSLSQALLDFGIGPINGDYELVEAGIAFAIFCFLPLCQITDGHAKVDLFTGNLPDAANRVLRLIIDVVFAIALIVIAWRLYDGTMSKMRYGETTFLLQFPIWWAYGASCFAAFGAALTGTYVAFVRGVELATQSVILADSEGADH